MILGKTKDGFEVRDRQNSHIQSHSSVTPFLAEALGKISVDKRNFIAEEINLGRIIGKNICVKTDTDDEIVYASRPKRFGKTRFVKTKKSQDCSTVMVVMKKFNGDSHFTLMTSFIGGAAPNEPWDNRAFNRSENPVKAKTESTSFWNSHALVWGEEKIISGTENTICPW